MKLAKSHRQAQLQKELVQQFFKRAFKEATTHAVVITTRAGSSITRPIKLEDLHFHTSE